ncbi:hypothetical protein [Rhodovibrio salinarum]|uniref:hypothetical protein n=1 Tax=Rhodovibrio salinarum TaxID=1087 RepID=UPI0012DED895|nr:hypothetical protein [Rhodovibrio salinarum]
MLREESIRLAWQSLKYPLLGFANLVALTVGAVGGVAGVLPLFSASQAINEIVQSAALAIIAIAALGAFGVREVTFLKRRRVANTVNEQRAASETLRDLSTYLDNVLTDHHEGRSLSYREQDWAVEEFCGLLDYYSRMFSTITSTRCRATIKLIFVENHELYVYALARDKISSHEMSTRDERRLELRHDRLEDNEDFKKLFLPDFADSGFYLNNYLPYMNSYESSSLTFWQEIEGDNSEWPLPYRSTVVWPIRQDQRRSIGEDESLCIGFLAVDSDSTGVFDQRWTVPIGKTLANSLYHVLLLYNELTLATQPLVSNPSNGEVPDHGQECQEQSAPEGESSECG